MKKRNKKSKNINLINLKKVVNSKNKIKRKKN